MNLVTEAWRSQKARWPRAGRHILAQLDRDAIVVYQAYRPAIGRFAAERGYFGGEFSFDRMSWVKPNFLWMMFRSGWGTKPGQAVTLAVRLRREAFAAVLADAVHSAFDPAVYLDAAAWKRALGRSAVRLQWDPDHEPGGQPLERRAIQLRLRGPALARYAREWIVSIEDISGFVAGQRPHVLARDYGSLLTPREDVYPVTDPAAASRLGIDTAGGPPVAATADDAEGRV